MGARPLRGSIKPSIEDADARLDSRAAAVPAHSGRPLPAGGEGTGPDKKKGRDEMSHYCDNTRPCPCTYDCPRHGKCCECVAHHRDHNEGVPGCFFSKEAEATYDRSIEALARDHGIIQ